MKYTTAIKLIKEAFKDMDVRITHSQKGHWINFERTADDVNCEFYLDNDHICGDYEINGRTEGLNLYVSDRTDLELLVVSIRAILELGKPKVKTEKYPPLRLIQGGKAA